MKKSGFTLAEILISLTIIGVVAALTTPALIQDVSNAKVGPTLSKFKSSMENANRMIMQQHTTIDLEAAVQTGIAIEEQVPDYTGYINELTNHLRGSRALTGANQVNDNASDAANFSGATLEEGGGYYDGAPKLQLPNNVLVTFIAPPGQDVLNYNHLSASSSFRGALARIIVDIDGWNSGQNRMGFDMFSFIVDRNGGLIPEGSTAYATNNTPAFQNNLHWSAGTGNDMACNETTVGTGEGCAGSIFENNMSIIYK